MFYAQGDIVIELVQAPVPLNQSAMVGLAKGQFGIDPDGSSVLARGEVTGHRHRFGADSGVTMFRDDGLARDIPTELYIGHVKIPAKGATLLHEEHDTIGLPEGTYRIRRQREWNAEQSRVVAD